MASSVNETARLLGIGDAQLLKGDVAQILILSGGDCGGPVGGSHGSSNKAGLAWVRGKRLVAAHPGNARRLDVELIADVLEAVVGHGDALRVEGVGLDDVRSCSQVLAVTGESRRQRTGTKKKDHTTATHISWMT